MEPFELATLTKWESFYVRAYATPTIVHFCEVLLMSAVLSAPWQSFSQVATALTACGLLGFLYSLLVIRRVRKQSDYSPVFEDWLFHNVLPVISYSSIVIASALLQRSPTLSLFLIGGTTIVLLFIGIHNAWDAATFIAINRSQKRETANHSQPSEPKRSKSHKHS
jgi:hypothetical protein